MKAAVKKAGHAGGGACTNAQFRARLAESRVLDGDALHAVLRELETADDRAAALPIGDDLVRRQVLTRFQATTLLDEPRPRLVLGNYVLLDRLGRGGMGDVYKARHRRLKRLLAVKVLSPSSSRSASELARFQSEVQAAGRLEHPHIVSTYDADEVDGVQFLAMEFVDGLDLQALVKAHGPLSVAHALHCVWQAAQGLAYAHAKSVVHRDIKPANLILGADGRLRILDMGIAQIVAPREAADAGEGGSGAAMGSIAFLAPEQASWQGKADPRADLYSLGCTLYFLLTGRPPFGGSSAIEILAAHRHQPPPRLSDDRPDIPAVLEAVLFKLMEKRPESRYQRAAELIADLEPIVNAHRVPREELTLFVLGAGLAASESRASDERAIGHDTEEVTAPIVALPSADDNAGNAAEERDRRLVKAKFIVLGFLSLLAAAILIGLLRDGRTKRPRPEALSSPRRIAAIHFDSPDARAAHWALAVGGAVQIERDTSWETVSDLTKLPGGPFRLMSVQLGGNAEVDDAGLENLRGAASLQMLWLGSTNVGDRGIAHLAELRELRYLGLSDTRISDVGLRSLEQLVSLQTLRVAETRVTDAGLPSIERLTDLRTLRLGGTEITDAGLPRLLRLRRLESLDLSNTAVTDAGIALLASLSDLRRLDLRGTSVTPAAVDRLHEALPACRIRM